MQIRKWFVIVFLAVFSYLFTRAGFIAKGYTEKYEAELQEMYKVCNLEGWK